MDSASLSKTRRRKRKKARIWQSVPLQVSSSVLLLLHWSCQQFDYQLWSLWLTLTLPSGGQLIPKLFWKSYRTIWLHVRIFLLIYSWRSWLRFLQAQRVTDLLRDKLYNQSSLLVEARDRIRELEEEKRNSLGELLQGRKEITHNTELFADVGGSPCILSLILYKWFYCDRDKVARTYREDYTERAGNNRRTSQLGSFDDWVSIITIVRYMEPLSDTFEDSRFWKKLLRRITRNWQHCAS